MGSVIVCFILLLLSLINLAWQGDGWRVWWDGPASGAFVLVVILIVMLRRSILNVRAVSEKAGLPRELPRNRWQILPWLFLPFWILGLNFSGDVLRWVDGKPVFNWEFSWGNGFLKLVVMILLIVVVQFARLNQRILQIGRSKTGTAELGGPS